MAIKASASITLTRVDDLSGAPDNPPYARWTFDRVVSGTTFPENNGSYPLVKVGSTGTPTSLNGRAVFDGSQFLRTDFDFDWDAGFTVSLLVRLDSIDATQTLIQSRTVLGRGMSFFVFEGNNIGFDLLGLRVIFNKKVSADTFYHLAVTFDADTKALRLYVDGSLSQTVTLSGESTPNLASALWVGQSQVGTTATTSAGNSLLGQMDDLRIYDYPLTAENVAYLYNTKGQEAGNGTDGQDGAPGSDGNGIKSTSVTYQAHSSQTSAPTGTWSSTVPTLTSAKPYLWTRTVVTMDDSSTSISYSVSSTLESFEVGGRNLIYLSKGDSNGGFFKNFTVNAEEGYGELTFTQTGSNKYPNVSITEGFLKGIDEWDVGDQCMWSFDIMFTEWDVPDTATISEFWLGQRYSSSACLWNGPTKADMPKPGVTDGCMLNEWYHHVKKRIVPEEILNATDSTARPASIQINFQGLADTETATVTFRMKNVKLETGNVATDWTPAPEDMATAEEMENVEGVASDALSQAGENSAAIQAATASIEILESSIASLVTDANGSSLMTQTSSGWTFNIGGLQESVEANAATINSVIGDVSDLGQLAQNAQDLANDVAEKTAYITMTQDSSGDPVMELGRQDSDFRLRITNTSIDFMQGTSRIAYITNNQLYIQSSVVTDEMKIGATSGYIWKKRANNHMGLRWVDE